jgi:hypothetical protein
LKIGDRRAAGIGGYYGRQLARGGTDVGFVAPRDTVAAHP